MHVSLHVELFSIGKARLSANLSVQFIKEFLWVGHCYTNVDISGAPITLSCDVQHPIRTPSTGAAGARSNIDTSIYVSCFHRHVLDVSQVHVHELSATSVRVVEAIMSYTHQTRAILVSPHVQPCYRSIDSNRWVLWTSRHWGTTETATHCKSATSGKQRRGKIN